jgi:hypothetical protein
VGSGASLRSRDSRIPNMREHPQQGVDVDVTLKRQVERSVNSYAVDVATPLSFAVDVPGFDQIGDGALRCAFRDVEQYRDVSYPNPGIPSDQQQRIAVIRQEPKVGNGPQGVNRLLALHVWHHSKGIVYMLAYQKQPNNAR